MSIADLILAAGFEWMLTVSGAVIVTPDTTIGYIECQPQETAFYEGYWQVTANCVRDLELPTEEWNGGGDARIVLGADVWEGCRVVWHEDLRASGLWWLRAECPKPPTAP